MWAELGEDGGHEDRSDRYWLHHVGVYKVRNMKNIGVVDGDEIIR